MYTREQMAAANATSGGNRQRKQKMNLRWKSVTYLNEGFRNTVMQFENDQNLSRFVWRTAKANGMRDITLADVAKMLKAADETVFILHGDEDGRREFTAEGRKPTWVMRIDRKQMWAAMMTIENVGWAESYKREIEIQGEKREQRVWTLA